MMNKITIAEVSELLIPSIENWEISKSFLFLQSLTLAVTQDLKQEKMN